MWSERFDTVTQMMNCDSGKAMDQTNIPWHPGHCNLSDSSWTRIDKTTGAWGQLTIPSQSPGGSNSVASSYSQANQNLWQNIHNRICGRQIHNLVDSSSTWFTAISLSWLASIHTIGQGSGTFLSDWTISYIKDRKIRRGRSIDSYAWGNGPVVEIRTASWPGPQRILPSTCPTRSIQRSVLIWSRCVQARSCCECWAEDSEPYHSDVSLIHHCRVTTEFTWSMQRQDTSLGDRSSYCRWQRWVFYSYSIAAPWRQYLLFAPLITINGHHDWEFIVAITSARPLTLSGRFLRSCASALDSCQPGTGHGRQPAPLNDHLSIFSYNF